VVYGFSIANKGTKFHIEFIDNSGRKQTLVASPAKVDPDYGKNNNRVHTLQQAFVPFLEKKKLMRGSFINMIAVNENTGKKSYQVYMVEVKSKCIHSAFWTLS